MADVAAAGPSEESGLTDGEGGEVVVMHETLGVFRFDGVQPLLLAHGTQSGDGENLGLAAAEQAGAVSAGKETDLTAQGPDLVRLSVIGPPAFAQDARADGGLGYFAEGGLELVLGVGFAQRLDELRPALGHRLASLVLSAGDEIPVAAADELLDSGAYLVGEGLRVHLSLRLAHLSGHLLLEADELRVDVLADAYRLQHQRLGHLVGTGLHHDHGVAGPRHHEVYIAVIELGEGGVDHKLAVDVADASAGYRSIEGYIGYDEGGGGAGDRQNVRVVLLVGGEDGADHLDFVPHAFGEERPQRPVGEAIGDDRLASGPSFAAEEAAGYLARRV